MAYRKNKYKVLIVHPTHSRVESTKIVKQLLAAGYVFGSETRYKNAQDVRHHHYFNMVNWKYIIIGNDKECNRVITAINRYELYKGVVGNFKTITVEELIKLDLLK